LKNTVEKIIRRQSALSKKLNRQSDLLGYVKLALLLLFAVSIYFMVKRWDFTIYKIVSGVLLAAQIPAWIFHARLDENLAHAAGLIEINKRHLDRMEGRWSAFSDTGEEFADPGHPYCCDLDIVGKKSLFQFLNTTHTWHGRHTFIQDLLYADYTEQEISRRQAAVEELALAPDFTDEMEYLFSQIGCDPAAPALVKELQENRPFLKNKMLRALLLYWPLATLFFVGLVIIFHWKSFYIFAVCLYVAQTFLWLAGLLFTGKYLKSVFRLPFKLAAYGKVLGFLGNATFQSEYLRQIQADLTNSDVSAAKAIKELSKIADKVSVRSNAIVYFVLNVLLLWDFECAFLFEHWRQKYAPHCEKWFLALGEIESLSCFATLRKVCSHTCYPRASSHRCAEAEELGHPLIPEATRVTNPLRLQENIIIVSGSNMSGKTTYLRTVGINIVLARAGGPVCAKSMALSAFRIYTSMRIADDLNAGISTFYAELKRIKMILEAAETDCNTLFLIDEIFRGTNSADRLEGGRTVISRLAQTGTSGFITTHDLDLCNLEQTAPHVVNNHFCESYENDRIIFDYKLHPGRSRSTNAKYLMKMLGIV